MPSKLIHRLFLLALAAALVAAAALSTLSLAANFMVYRAKNAGIYALVESTPPRAVAVVLGTTKRAVGGGVNPFFAARIDAAAALYKAGRARHILVSGDNRHKSHNEPVDMLNALIAAGVPAGAVTLDYAGFRTLDTVYRAKKVFLLDDVLLVTQRYHAYRALYLARSAGLNAIAFAAAEPGGSKMAMAELREYAARVKAVIDVHILRKQPRFLGEPEPIRLEPAATSGLSWRAAGVDGRHYLTATIGERL